MIVSIKQGLLKGRTDTSLTTSKVFYSFLGIPYAEPPIGELRFQPPVPASGWKGTRDATFDRNRCIQLVVPEPTQIPSNESEDCLYVNVFTPEPPNPKAPLKPVMVYLHGGGYYVGTGSMDVAAPDHLVNYDVIFVSFNFRLHIFGFLNLNTPSSTGNCGCKDQVLALRWVKENIRSFGGDPQNVTICGVSAGGISAHLLTISPLAAGLFHKVIVESGSVIGPCIVENQEEAGMKIGRKLGFTGTNSEDLVKFLKKQPAETLTKEARNLVVAQKADAPFAMSGFKIFVPSIEKCAQNGVFLPDYPINLISTSQTVPMIAGVAEKEGVIVLFGLDSYENFFERLKSNLVDLVKSNVPCDPSKMDEIATKVKEYYFDPLGSKATDEEIREKIVEIYSHLFFMNLYKLPEKTTKAKAPLYMYKFHYVGGLNVSPWSKDFSGALHATHAGYITLFRGLYQNGVPASEADRATINYLCTAWTNFARTSNPNPLPDPNIQWKPHTSQDPSYILFDKSCTSMKGKIWNEGIRFWEEIFRDYVEWNSNNTRLKL